MDVTIGWWDIAKIVLASGALAAGLQWLKESRKDAKKFKAEATLNAIGLVGILDRYVGRCYREVKKYDGEVQYYVDSDWCVTPELDIGDAKLDYFSASVLARLAWLKTERTLAFDHAADTLDFMHDAEGYQDHCISITGYCGYEIALVAQTVRKEHGLPELSSEWNMKGKVSELKIYWSRAKNTLQ
jgi:hypothetical protein